MLTVSGAGGVGALAALPADTRYRQGQDTFFNRTEVTGESRWTRFSPIKTSNPINKDSHIVKH